MSDSSNTVNPADVRIIGGGATTMVDGTSGDMGNFEALTAKLLQVPKSELDEKRQQA